MIGVVGGGIAGAACVFALAKRGLPCVLVDATDACTSGASAVPSAVLNPFRGKRAEPTALDWLGFERFLSVVAELGAEACGWHPVGVVRVADHAARAAAWKQLRQVQWLAPMECDAVTGLSIDAPHGAFLFARGGYVESARIRRALLEDAVRRGAELLLDTRVEDALPARTGVRLVTPRGAIELSALITCTGAHALPSCAAVDLRQVDGEVLEWDRTARLTAADTAVPEPVIVARCLLIRAAQHIWAGGVHTRVAAPDDLDARDRGVHLDGAAQLQRAAAALVPSLAAAPPLRCFRATRSATTSNVPRVRQVGPRIWAVEALAGRGYLRAFDLADQAVEALLAETST